MFIVEQIEFANKLDVRFGERYNSKMTIRFIPRNGK
jgi:hypothetical protein